MKIHFVDFSFLVRNASGERREKYGHGFTHNGERAVVSIKETLVMIASGGIENLFRLLFESLCGIRGSIFTLWIPKRASAKDARHFFEFSPFGKPMFYFS